MGPPSNSPRILPLPSRKSRPCFRARHALSDPTCLEMPLVDYWTYRARIKVSDLETTHEDLQVGALFGWVAGPMLEEVAKYKETLKYPNPPASNLTKF